MNVDLMFSVSGNCRLQVG